MHNALGELKRQVDAKNQTTPINYDQLGRMTQRNEPDLVSTWTYDSCTKGIGKLCSTSANNNTSRSVAYDSIGRVQSTTTLLDTPHTVTHGYDANGRLDTLTYPTGQVAKHIYHGTLGYLQKVTDNGALTYWELLGVSASGKITSERAGNGVVTTRTYDVLDRLRTVQAGPGNAVQNNTYSYDTIGNLTQRADAVLNSVENYGYDTLNRLTHDGSGQIAWYDVRGNITAKAGTGTYGYGGNGGGPQALTSITGAGALTGASFYYDANGNMWQSNDPQQGQRNFSYTSFNMVASVTRGSNSLSFLYDSSHARVREIRVVDTVTTTVYFLHPDNQGGLLFEKEVSPSGTKYKHYINAAGGVVAVVTTGAVSSTEYWHKDHLGSTAVKTDAGGAVIAGSRTAFDPWGQSTVAGNGYRGFTGHEQFDDFGLIHMNGRIYDPRLGRFLQADPYVQNASNLQSFNRYSYVFNNPLAYTDPSGYFSLKAFFLSGGHVFTDRQFGYWKQANITAAAIVVSYFCAPCAPYIFYGGLAYGAYQAYRTNEPYWFAVSMFAAAAAGGSVGEESVASDSLVADAGSTSIGATSDVPVLPEVRVTATRYVQPVHEQVAWLSIGIRIGAGVFGRGAARNAAKQGAAAATGAGAGATIANSVGNGSGAGSKDPSADLTVNESEAASGTPDPDDKGSQPRKSRAELRQKKIDQILKDKNLPNQGEFKFEPRSNWNPSESLPRGPRGGYLDKYGNEWINPRGQIQGQRHWDVQLPSGKHVNVLPNGSIPH